MVPSMTIIYTANGPEVKGEKERTDNATIAVSPVSPTDSILLPTAADIGFKGWPKPKLINADPANLKAAVVGMYQRETPFGRKTRLTIDDTTLQVVSGPRTTTYSYKIIGQDEDGIILELTAPDTHPFEVVAAVTDNTLQIDADFPTPRSKRTSRAMPM